MIHFWLNSLECSQVYLSNGVTLTLGVAEKGAGLPRQAGRESCLPLGVPVRAGARGMEGSRLSAHRPFPTLGSRVSPHWGVGQSWALGPGGQCRLEKWQSSWQQAGGRRGRCPFGDRGAVEQVQADQYIPEDDIHREVDTIERQLDALEHRGVQLEEKLRGGMNGAGSWERLAGGTQGWREPLSLGGVGTAASPGLSAHLASREP